MRGCCQSFCWGRDCTNLQEPSGGRSQEVRFAIWREIDLSKCLWNVPPEHMKTRKVHHVALANEAIGFLHIITRHAGNELIFSAPRGGVMSDATISECIKRINERDQKNWWERVL